MRFLEWVQRPDVIAGLAIIGAWSCIRFVCTVAAALEATGRASIDRLLGPDNHVEW